MIVGDIVHNLRFALDHLVCQLAILNGNDVSCCNDTYFPICICKRDFRNAHRMIEPLNMVKHSQILSNCSHTMAGNLAGREPNGNNLWIISKLDIIDKHRMLILSGKHFRTTDVTYTLDDETPVDVETDDVWHPLKEGAQIAVIDLSSLSPGPEDRMRVPGANRSAGIFQRDGMRLRWVGSTGSPDSLHQLCLDDRQLF